MHGPTPLIAWTKLQALERSTMTNMLMLRAIFKF